MSTPAESKAARLASLEHDVEQLEVELLLEAVYHRYGTDFRRYARASLKRRLYRRLHAEGLETLSQLQDRLLHDPPCMEIGRAHV